MSLEGVGVSWKAGRRLVVDDVSVAVEPGSVLGILGPNGSGKSTLIRLLSGLRRPSHGRVLVDGAELRSLSRRELARRLAVVEQEVSTDTDLTVAEVVALGRTPHRGGWRGLPPQGDPAVSTALAQAGLSELSGRRWHSLSGGERQRAQIARALAQEPSELLLDEPTNHLDIAHQMGILGLIRELPITSIVALHDLNLAAMFCDRLLVLAEGRAVAAGPPSDVLTEDLIARVYGVRARVRDTLGRLHIEYVAPVDSAADQRTLATS
jgi:iron complex transport system ATP-binding protein